MAAEAKATAARIAASLARTFTPPPGDAKPSRTGLTFEINKINYYF
jgi:hypothetical protein